jgi:uncharacterized protein with HEPN domain
MRRDRSLLDDIVTAANAACNHAAGLDEDTFASVRSVRSAVAYELIVIGEAANLLSTATRAEYPEVPWPVVVGLRNRVTHGYFAVDWSVVYDVVTRELPALIESIRAKQRPPGHGRDEEVE